MAGRGTSVSSILVAKRKLQLAVLLFVLGCAFSSRTLAQTLPNITPGDELGELPYISYHGGDVDAVSLINGGLSLHAPLLSYPQRGNVRVSYGLKYNNTLQHYGPLCTPPPLPSCELDWGLNFPAPVLEKSDVFVAFDQALGIWRSQPYTKTWKVGLITYSDNYGDYYVSEPDGSEHILGNLGTAQLVKWPSPSSPNSYLVSSGPSETLDATGIKVIGALAPVPGPPENPPTIVTSDGLTYTGGSIQDSNGNVITSNSSGIIDSIGRSIPVPPTQGSSSNTSTSICPPGPLTVTKAVAWNVPAVSGGTATYTFCYVTVTPNMPSQMLLANQLVYGPISPSTNLQSIVLPNGLAWKFEYDDQDSTLTNNGQPVTYGTISKITLPTGGSISYTWINAGKSLAANNSQVCNNGGRWVATRTVTDLDGIARTWNYTYGVTFGSYFGTVVTDPLGNDTAHVFGFPGGGISAGCHSYETQTLYYQGSYSSGTLLRTVNTTYLGTATNAFPDPMIGVVPATNTTVEANNQTTETVEGYDAGFAFLDHFGQTGSSGIYGKVVSNQVYDYGLNVHGSLLRTTNTSYAWQSPNPNYASYLSNNLLDLPYSVQVKDSGGTQRAYTYYGYDESGLQSSTVTEQRGTAESHPGNETSVHRWLNGSTSATTICNVSVSNGYLVSNKVYYDTGEVQKSTDPCAYPTTYQYTATSPYYGAFLTTVTNALGQGTNYGYDASTGLVTSIQDPNLQTTTKRYDIMNRPTLISYPGGGSTSYCYTDMGGCSQTTANSVVITKAIKSSLSEISTLVFDGLGRLSQTQLNSDSPSTTYTLTTYDALGRKSQVYNPTRCSSITTNCGETTWGYTTTNYDPLGRVTSVVEQDTSTVSTSYASVPCTTVTDETGKARQSCVDGLGRMTSVLEDPGTSPHLNYQTLYQYDVLGNLTNVTQNGSNSANARTRGFVYDSLSHLTSAQNPESGTITYAYDADGNAVKRTAPSPNQPSTGTSTVATTYTYDKLNRLIGKAYADTYTSNPATATASYGYDGLALIGCNTPPPTLPDSYPKGRRTAMCDGSGATSWSHDTMGREFSDIRTVDGITQTTSYTYNLDGSLSTLTYPGTGQTITYTPGGAGRPTAAQDLTNSVNYVESATYAPFGGLTSMVNGLTASFTGFTTTNAYNDRLQPILLSAATSSGSVYSVCYDFHLGVVVNTSPCSFAKSTLGDNGNVYQVVNNRPGYSGRTQAFTYDVLNRITSGQSSGAYWGENFTIDAWGNLTQETGISGKTYSEGLNVSVGTNNRFTTASGVTYDAAGNLISQQSGPNYRYDAENRLVYTSAGGYNYYYDGDGNRVAKSNGTTGTAYWRGPTGDPIFESSLTGTNQEEYIFFNGSRVARMDVGSNAAHYYFSDHLGSSAVVETANGSSCEQDIDYYPYGGVMSDFCPNIAQHYRFTGKERDTETGLDEFGARYYGSNLGRFMTPDWEAKPTAVPYASFGNPQSLNLYSYVNNNPTTTRDPDGHCPDGMDVCFMPQLAQDPNYMAGYQKGAGAGSMLFAGGALLAGAWEAGGIFLRNVLGLGLASAPQAQRAASALADLAAPPGTPSFSVAGAAEAFGFKSIDAAAGGLVGGELQSGARAAVNFSKAGSELGVGISMVKGPAGTLQQIESGAVSAAKATNSNSVKITATMVKDSMGRLLQKNGFVQELKDGKATGRWIKTITVKNN